MGKIIKLESRKHIYDIDNCAGCGNAITGEYKEIGLPSPDNKEVRHIALCNKCSKVAKKEGVL